MAEGFGVGMVINLLILAVVIGVMVTSAVKVSGLPSWASYPILVVLAVACYILCAVLTGRFIRERAPDFLSNEETEFGVQKWELTAGLGIVPKWVSLIGLASIACLIALVIPLIASLLK